MDQLNDGSSPDNNYYYNDLQPLETFEEEVYVMSPRRIAELVAIVFKCSISGVSFILNIYVVYRILSHELKHLNFNKNYANYIRSLTFAIPFLIIPVLINIFITVLSVENGGAFGSYYFSGFMVIMSRISLFTIIFSVFCVSRMGQLLTQNQNCEHISISAKAIVFCALIFLFAIIASGVLQELNYVYIYSSNFYQKGKELAFFFVFFIILAFLLITTLVFSIIAKKNRNNVEDELLPVVDLSSHIGILLFISWFPFIVLIIIIPFFEIPLEIMIFSHVLHVLALLAFVVIPILCLRKNFKLFEQFQFPKEQLVISPLEDCN